MRYLLNDFKRYTDNPNLYYVIKSYFTSYAKKSIILYRLSSYLYLKKFRLLSILIKNYNQKLTGCEIGEECIIGKGLYIGHSNGIVISPKAKIGENLRIMQQVTIGSTWGTNNNECVIGNNVFIGAGAKILGVKIGDNVTIGANSVVIKDVPDNCIVAGIPAKVVKYKD